jgi:DNA repair exonuclease SbcCD nuclease subunit
MKLVHAADLHLDSPLRGLVAYDGAPLSEIRGATRRALENLTELCLDEEAQLLVLAGDLYDGDWRDYSTGLFFVEQMARLGEAGVSVVWIRGNHDAASLITRQLSLPKNVRELSHAAPETVVFEQLGVAVHGVGYARRDVRENLAVSYPAPLPGLFNLGLLHTALEGRAGHEEYAPCSRAELVARGYEYWALGHVHRREVVGSEPWIVFPGNLQGRHINEVGPKGASLVTLEGRAVRSVEHRALDVVRWARCEVKLDDAHSLDDVLELAARELGRAQASAEGRVLACRIVLSGATEAHSVLQRERERLLAELRAVGIRLGGVYVEQVEISARPRIDLEGLRSREDAVGELFRGVAELLGDDEARAALRAEVLLGLDGLPQHLREEHELDELLADAERLLLGCFLDGSSDSGGVEAARSAKREAEGA